MFLGSLGLDVMYDTLPTYIDGMLVDRSTNAKADVIHSKLYQYFPVTQITKASKAGISYDVIVDTISFGTNIFGIGFTLKTNPKLRLYGGIEGSKYDWWVFPVKGTVSHIPNAQVGVVTSKDPIIVPESIVVTDVPISQVTVYDTVQEGTVSITGSILPDLSFIPVEGLVIGGMTITKQTLTYGVYGLGTLLVIKLLRR